MSQVTDGSPSRLSGPPHKKSKPSSCAECRRLKIRCDQLIPCGSCVARNRQQLCPDKVLSGIRDVERERDQLAARNRELEEMLERVTAASGHDQPNVFPTWTPLQLSAQPEDSSNPFEQPGIFDNIPGPSTWMEAAETRAQTLESILTAAPRVAARVAHQVDDSPKNDSGTLVSAPGERYIHLGPSAGMQWLRTDLRGGLNSRPGSPKRQEQAHGVFGKLSPGSQAYADLFAQLPRRQTAETLIQNYLRRAAWMGSPMNADEIQEYIETVYQRDCQHVRFDNFHELAVVFALCSFGTSLDMEAPPLGAKATLYLEFAQEALVAGRWLVYTTIPSLRALCLICKALPYANVEFRWDYTWQLTGSCMRMILAMGLHRDGMLWGLTPRIVDVRRRIFWDWMGTNAFMSANWDRLPGIASDQYDALYPEDWVTPRSFFAIHSDLARLATEALNDTHKLGQASYSRVMDIYGDILALESGLPFHLRCRAAVLAMTSKYRSAGEAEAAVPAPDPDDIERTMQQHYLVFVTYRAVHTCLHAYFVSALKDSPAEPTKSAYGAPFITVVERSSMVIATLESLYTLYPLVSLRHWHFWTHGFSAAMVLCVVLIVSPTSVLAPLAKRDLETMMGMIPVLKTHLPREQIRKDTEWLARLYKRAVAQTDAKTPQSNVSVQAEEELRTLGWRTKLIGQRVRKGADNQIRGEQAPADLQPMMLGLDASWWKEPIPPPLQASDLGLGTGQQDSMDEWLQGLFEA